MDLMDKYINELNKLEFSKMYNDDFMETWKISDDELKAVFTVAEALRDLRKNNISTKIFDSGLGISLFRDNST
ncbi:knotted carbamoyltransferase YgeW, partial [Clostridium sp. HCS.1]